MMGILMLTVNHIERRDLRKEAIAWGGEDHIEIAQSFFQKGKSFPQVKAAKQALFRFLHCQRKYDFFDEDWKF